jgi:hypothetical protein
MGIVIEPLSGVGERVTIVCDVLRSVFCHRSIVFEGASYGEASSAATAAGWMDGQDAQLGRMLICPACRAPET